MLDSLNDGTYFTAGVFAVTSSTAVYEMSSYQGFVPPVFLKQFDPADVSSTFSSVPPGLEGPFKKLHQWVLPFIYDSHTGMQFLGGIQFLELSSS